MRLFTMLHDYWIRIRDDHPMMLAWILAISFMSFILQIAHTIERILH